MTKGLVEKIKRFSVHDGPGIRTVVFLKGCHLRCQWCSSPLTWLEHPLLYLNVKRCKGCYKCFDVCPNDAIRKTVQGIIHINFKKCKLCGECIKKCPENALEIIGQYLTVEEVKKEVLEDRLFYEDSGGGVTISGGEPLLQVSFVEELADVLKKGSIHIAIETSGTKKWQEIKSCIKHFNLVMLDIKHMDPKKHNELTGIGNENILENAVNIKDSGVNLVIRYPFIPGFNDDEKNIGLLMDFLVKNEIRKIEILPFHKLGLTEYEGMGIFEKVKKLKDIKSPSVEELNELKNSFLARDINAKIVGL